MIGDKYIIDGAPFFVHHVLSKNGLVHQCLSTDGKRLWAPQHGDDSTLRNAVTVTDDVVTCFTCINHTFESTPLPQTRFESDD